MELPANHVSFYTILSVEPNATIQDIKISYRKLLLLHHPDKSHSNQNVDDEPKAGHVNIAQIKNAYNTLMLSREEYDDALHEFQIKQGHVDIDGMDHFDLDEFEFIEQKELFLLNCPRCTAFHGFKVTEDDLEHAVNAEVEIQNLLLQCKDCSLWICVNYSVS